MVPVATLSVPWFWVKIEPSGIELPEMIGDGIFIVDKGEMSG